MLPRSEVWQISVARQPRPSALGTSLANDVAVISATAHHNGPLCCTGWIDVEGGGMYGTEQLGSVNGNPTHNALLFRSSAPVMR